MNLPPNREVALFSAALELPGGLPAAYLVRVTVCLTVLCRLIKSGQNLNPG